MANYQSLKTAINAVIKANGNKEITGTVLNEVLLAIVNSLGAGYQFAGVAKPSTNPGTPDQKVFYIASQAGTYTNFGGAVVSDGIAIFEWNGTWTVETLDLSMAGQVQSDWTETDTTKKSYIKHKPNIPPSANVDPVPTNGSPNAVASGGVYNALKTITDFLNNGYYFVGIAGTSTVPDSVTQYGIFYIASDGGTYTNFLNGDDEPLTLYQGLNILYKDIEDDGWNYFEVFKFSDFVDTTQQQSLTSQQKAQARTNIAAVSYDAQSLNADQQIQAQNNMMGKAYSSTASDHSGLGKVYLDKNNGVLTQSMINVANTVYVIQYDYTLGENITIPAGCTLQFDGGSISNASGNTYAIKGTFAINDAMYQIFNNINFVAYESILKSDFIRPEWFGAKGDFDFENKSGTDDSEAISNAIRAAELLNVGKVKFTSANYLVVLGVNIVRGNIWLDGVRALLREEQWETEEPRIYTRGSMLVCPKNTNILTFGENVADPIRITNIQFECYEADFTASTKAINFISEYSGPTWPFIVEYCHFRRFNYAIFFNSTNKYCVYGVRINNNAFARNNWCVYFNEQSVETNPPLHSNLTWSFDFKNNMAHDNVHILKVCSIYNRCEISGNNMEGNIIYNDGVGFQNKISIGNYTDFIFADNHFESITIPILQLENIYNPSYVTIKGNSVYGITDKDNCIVTITGGGRLVVKEKQPEFRFHLQDINTICLDSKKPIVFTAQRCNKIYCVVDEPFNSIDSNTYDANKHFPLPLDMVGVFRGKDLCSQLITKPNEYGISLVNNNSNRTLLMFFAYFGKVNVNKNKIFCLLDNVHNETIYFHSFELLEADVDGRYCYEFLFLDYQNTSGYQFYTYANADVKNYGYAKKNIGINDVYSSTLFNNLILESNICDDLANTTISNPQLGDKIFNITDNKEYTHNGTTWVDATGTTI